MKYSINMLLWTDNCLDDKYLPVMERLKKMGYDGIELPIFAPDPAKYAALGRKLDALGLGRTAVAIALGETNPISPDANIRKKAVEHMKLTVDSCKESGSETMVGPFYAALGQFSGQGRTADEWKWGLETMRTVAEYARKQGVDLALEFLNRFEIYFLNCAADADKFVKEIGIPGTGMLYDTFHANIEEKSPAKAIAACASTLKHVHVSENDRSTPGSGGVRWEETFKALREARFDGWLCIEAFGMAMPSVAAATKIWRRMYVDEDQLARDGLAFMKRMSGA
jgi:D-psicose/D-tagatose/L-ribulose 3-epimerase